MAPPTMPQKAEPMPSNVTPEAVMKGDQRRVALFLIMQRALQAAADGAEQRQPGDGVDQGDRQRAEQQADGAAEQPGQQVETAGGTAPI